MRPMSRHILDLRGGTITCADVMLRLLHLAVYASCGPGAVLDICAGQLGLFGLDAVRPTCLHALRTHLSHMF